MTVSIKLAAALLAALPLLCSAADLPVIPVDHFTDPETYTHPLLSPDGKMLALKVRMKRNDRMIPTISIYTVPDLKHVSTIGMRGFEVPVTFYWVNNTRLVVQKGLEQGDRLPPEATGEVVAVNVDGTKPQYLYGYDNFLQSSMGDRYGADYGYGEVASIPKVRTNSVQLGTYLWRAERSALYDVDTLSSARKLLADIPHQYLDFHVQNNGVPRFATGSDDNNIPVVFRRDDAGKWNKLDTREPRSRYHPMAFTADDKGVYVSHSKDGGPYVIMVEDLASGVRTHLAGDPISSVDELQFTSGVKIPFAYTTSSGIPRYKYLLPDHPDAVLHKTLSASFPDAIVDFINYSDDGQKVLFQVASDRDPGSYYLFDRAQGKAQLLLSNMENIDAAQMAERRPIQFQARDGLTIEGYLTIPKHAAKGKVPMVLLPHGGPFGPRDRWFFDTDAQFLASRGYAVLQVNFRGSGGRGLNFRDAGYRQWGGKIMDDLADGVKYASGLPMIDANRMCVFGASFGGYSALMLPVREPGMFKCAVGYAGVYHLPTIFKHENVANRTSSVNFYKKSMGDDMAELEKQSPSKLAAQITLPVLLIHGGNDKVAEIKHAHLMREALKDNGNKAQWMLEKEEGHGFYDADRRKALYETLEAFLAKHIGK